MLRLTKVARDGGCPILALLLHARVGLGVDFPLGLPRFRFRSSSIELVLRLARRATTCLQRFFGRGGGDRTKRDVEST